MPGISGGFLANHLGFQTSAGMLHPAEMVCWLNAPLAADASQCDSQFSIQGTSAEVRVRLMAKAQVLL
jgi:hypothetical protein